MKLFKKYWFLIINIIAFVVGSFDGLLWKDCNVGFPVFTIYGCLIASLIGGIYQIIQTLVNRKDTNLISRFIVLYFTVPFYGFIGAFLGLMIGGTIFFRYL